MAKMTFGEGDLPASGGRESFGAGDIPEETAATPVREPASTPLSLMQQAAASAAVPAIGATAGGVVAGHPGALLGSMALPLGDAVNLAINAATSRLNSVLNKDWQIPQLGMPSQIAAGWLGLPEPQTQAERVVRTAGGAFGGTASQLPALTRLATTAATPMGRGIAGVMAQAPKTQMAIAAPAGAASQYAHEEYGPVAGMVAPLVVGGVAGMRPKAREAVPTADELFQRAGALYGVADQTGIVVKPGVFKASMKTIAKNLRAEGYTPTGYPKVGAALDELISGAEPKTMTEMQVLRKIVGNAAASIDPAERRLGSILKTEYDNYVMALQPKDILAGKDPATALKAWSDARGLYGKAMKSEVFSDMLAKAELDNTKFTQAGMVNSLHTQMRNLAKAIVDNKPHTRVFTQAEKAEITKMAKGTATSKTLHFISRFAPTSTIPAMGAGGLMAYEPTIGIPATAAAMGARHLLTGRTVGGVESLGEMMRLGRMPSVTSGYQAGPAMRSGMIPLSQFGQYTQEEQ